MARSSSRLIAVVSLSSLAWAADSFAQAPREAPEIEPQQEDAPPPAPPAPPPAPAPPPPPPVAAVPPPLARPDRPADDAPAAHSGFQLAVRSGVQIAAGAPAEGGTMSNQGPELPIMFDLGAKTSEHLFVGAYGGIGIGGASGGLCSSSGVSCLLTTVRGGIELQYHVSPDKKVNPWLGYGFGYEWNTLHASASGQSGTATIEGFELAHLSLGVDFRTSRAVGWGPVVGMSFGQYSQLSAESGGQTESVSIEKTALHEWFSIGLRVVFNP